MADDSSATADIHRRLLLVVDFAAVDNTDEGELVEEETTFWGGTNAAQKERSWRAAAATSATKASRLLLANTSFIARLEYKKSRPIHSFAFGYSTIQ